MDAVADFTFDAKVASVFDDMLNRSVPFYGETQRMVAEMAADYAVEGTKIYDLGCSTGTTMLGIGSAVGKDVSFVGVDSSEEMLVKCRQKLDEHAFPYSYELVAADLNDEVMVTNASVVVMVLTLQFVRPLNREALMRSIFEGLHDQGALLLVEKVLGESSDLNRAFIDYHYRMKRRSGYSEMEIAQKREALENVLIPYKLTENMELIRRSGFRSQDVFFKWYSFCGIVAVK
jgi:tRNA (cmo5U34)-methyltransferase